MIIKKDSKIVKAKGEMRSLALKAKKESSYEECSTSKSKDKEYVMTVIENVLDAAIQIIILGNVQNHQETRTKGHLSEGLGAIAVKKMMNKSKRKHISWLKHQMIMILELVKHGPLIWPTVEDNGVTRTKKYAELSAAEKIQADCTSLTKQERECKLYDAVDKFTHIKGESLHKYYLRFTQLINDMNIYNMKMEQFQVNAKLLNSLPPEWSKFVTNVKLVKDFHTTNFDQLHAYLEQHELHANEVRLLRERNHDPLAFMANQRMTPSTTSSRLPSTNNQLRTSSNPRNQATIQDDRVKVQQVQGRQRQSYSGTTYKGNATSSRGNNASKRARVVKCYNCQDLRVPDDQAVQTIILNNVAFQTEDLDTYDSDCDDISNIKAVLMANISNFGYEVILVVPHSETYLNDMENQIFKSESKEKEDKYIENEIDLEKKIKELDNILFKVSQSAQAVYMLTKLQAFFDNIHKQALCYQNPFHLQKAQRIKPTLYDGIFMSDKHIAMYVIDDEETLILEEVSRLRMSKKEKDPELCMSNPTSKPCDALPVKIKAPKELPKISLVNKSLKKLKFHLAKFDNVVKIKTTPNAHTEAEANLRTMSSPNHPTSNIEDAFSSNFLDFIPASSEYVPASPGKTYSSSSNSFCVVPIASQSLSLLHDDPCIKVLQAFYIENSPIPPPSLMPNP
nr:hypothetical protein [Tanacetum cinerariifolium]